MVRSVTSLPHKAYRFGLLAFALLLGSSDLAAQEPQWEAILGDNDVTISWDRMTPVRQSDDVLRVWIRTFYVRVQHLSGRDSLTFKQVIARYDFDCVKKVSRIIQRHWYAPDGALARSSDQVSDWTELVPAGYEAKTLFLVCEKQPPASIAAPAPSRTARAAPSLPTKQPATGHSGFHAAVGAGYGSASATCDGCGTGRDNSLALMLRFGGAVLPNVVLSGEFTGWGKQVNGDTESLGWSSVVAQVYPDPSGGFFVKIGAGVSTGQLVAYIPTFGSVQANRTSLGLQAGAGFDIAVSPGFAVTPFFDFLYGAPSSVTVNGTNTGFNMGTNLLHLGMAASWR